ncbi:MAG: PAS domain S-box protein [Gemmatimonadaceae bacterium]|nr:PAS domain S-box protein [Gemmatimonadaceae bacterium]
MQREPTPATDGAAVSPGLASSYLTPFVEPEVLAARERFAMTCEQAPVGIAHQTLDGRWLWINQRFCELLGWPREELLDNTLESISHPDDLAATREFAEHVRAGSRAEYTIERRYLRKDGGVVWARRTVSLVRDGLGQPAYLVTFLHDVTDQKRGESDLRESETRYRELADAAAERASARAGFLADASRLLGASFDHQTTLATLARLSVPQLADFCMVDVVEPDDTVKRIGLAHVDPSGEEILRSLATYAQVDRHLGPFHPVFEGESLFVPEVREELLTLGASDAEQLRLRSELGARSCISVPLVSSNRVLGALTLVHSVSGRRYDEDDLAFAATLARRAALAIENARLFDAAQRATRARDEMLGIVAHDLRNPLGTIQLAAQFLEELVPGEQSIARKQLATLRRASDRMKRLIDDLLDVKRIEAGTLTVVPRPESVASLVEDAVMMLDPLAASAGLVTEWSVEPGLPAALVDPQRIQQTIANLVGNAVRFTARGGTVALRARRSSDGICFEVADSGPGIRPDEIPHLFGRFWQGDRSDRRRLGLAIAKAIVDGHGGRIWVESKVGEGSSFYFTVPAAR